MILATFFYIPFGIYGISGTTSYSPLHGSWLKYEVETVFQMPLWQVIGLYETLIG